MSVVRVVVECCVRSVEVCKNVGGYVVVEEGVYVGVGDVCVGSDVRGGHHEWAMLCVQLHCQEVSEPPLSDKFVPKCMFDEDGNAVVQCFCRVSCGVSVMFYGCVCSACAV